MKHLAFVLLATVAGALAHAQTYNYFPPPGYNCSAGPPAQIPFASTANKLLCTSLLSWNNSTDVLNIGAATTPGTFSVGALDTMVINGVTVPIPGFAINSNIQGVIENHSYVAGGPTGGARYYGVRSRGTISAPAIVQNGDNLTSWYAAGYNGSTYSLGAQILAQVTGTPGASAMPTDLDFLVSAAGSQTPTSRLRVKNDGSLSVSGSVGTSGQPLLSAGTGAAAGWGTLTVPGGGTGATTLTAHGVLLGEATSAIGAVSAMAADTLLQGQGAAADPAAVSLVNCGSSTQALAYSTSTHTFSCQTISTTPSGPGTSVTTKLTTDEVCSACSSVIDPTLSFTSIAAGSYKIECFLIIAAGSGSFTGNIQAPGSPTGAWFELPYNGGSNSPSNSLTLNSGSTIPIGASQTGAVFTGNLVTAVSGTIGIQRNGTFTWKAGSNCVLTTL